MISLGSTGLHLSDVPCLRDSSAFSRGGLSELWGANVVTDLGDRTGAEPAGSFELAAGVSLYHNLIARLVDMLSSRGIFGFVVLKDAMLLPFLNVLPIGFERHIKKRVSPKG